MSVSSEIPNRLLNGAAGVNPRIEVEQGATGFFDGRQFRSYIEAVIPVAGPSVQFQFISPIDFLLLYQDLNITQGAIRCEIFINATDSGGWTSQPVFGVNRTSKIPQPPYTRQVQFNIGGNFTGGTPVDLILSRTATSTGAVARASNTTGSSTIRALPAGTYYGRFSTLAGGLTPTDACQLVYSLAWEERP